MIKKTFLMKLILTSALLAFCFVSGFAQQFYYTNPIPITLKLYAGFADLQNDRFHAGYDISTLGASGVAINAIADGFISRIVISKTGNGKSVFIEHDNGTTSVYSHLSNFRNDIEAYIKNEQYKQKSYEVDLKIEPGLFVIKRQQKIGQSGKSGDAEISHLHLEIRNTKLGDPINPAVVGLTIPDKTPPKFFALQIVPLSATSHVNYGNTKVIYETVFSDGKYVIKGNPVIPVYGPIGFAVEANDFVDGSDTPLGTVSFQLSVTGDIYSVFNINRFSLSDSKKINGVIDYEEYKRSGRRFQKTWMAKCNSLKNFEFTEKLGIIDVNMNKTYPVQIEIKDAKGNSSVLEFEVVGKYREVKTAVPKEVKKLNCATLNTFENDGLTLEIQPGTLFEDIDFTYNSEVAPAGCYSSLYHIQNESIPLYKNATISIQPSGLPENLFTKALLAKVDPQTGSATAAGGFYENGKIKGEISEFGVYTVKVDTIAPKIESLSIENHNKLTEPNQIRFKITDDFSGIDQIEGILDGTWALFEYDQKNNLVSHTFDSSRFAFGKKHTLKITVTDKKGNLSTYEASFEK